MAVKLTTIVDAHGNLIAAQEAQIRGEHDAGLIAGPGQTLHEIDAPDEIVKVTDPEKFHSAVLSALKTHLAAES